MVVVSVAAVLAAVLVLAVAAVRVGRALRSCRGTASMAAAGMRDRFGLVRARWAAVRVGFDRRRRRVHRTRTTQYDRA